MIPDDVGEEEKINFDWIRFIGTAKLNLRLKEVGRLTLRSFNRMYRAYKDDFDNEMMMKQSRTTYAKLKRLAEIDEEWW